MRPVERLVGIGVDRDLGRLARPHLGQLGFLEIGGDIDLGQRHQRQQLRPGLDVLPDPAGAVAGDAGDRRADHRVVEIVLGQPQGGARLLQPRLFLVALRPQHGELVSARRQRGALLRQRRRRLAGVGLGRLEALPAGEIARDQRDIALVVELGAGLIGLGRVRPPPSPARSSPAAGRCRLS